MEYYLQIFGKYEDAYQIACLDFCKERTYFYDSLLKISFLRVVKSQANYFLCEVVDKYLSMELTNILLNNFNILIKDCSNKIGFDHTMNIFNRSILAYRVFRSYLSRIRSLLLYYTVESYIIKKQQALNRQLEKKIQGKKLVNVCFFVLDSSIWKYDSLYFLMEKSTQFNPVLLITPYMTFSESERMEKMNATYNYFKNKGYRVIHSYNNKKEQWLDVMSEISPGIMRLIRKNIISDIYPEFYPAIFLMAI